MLKMPFLFLHPRWLSRVVLVSLLLMLSACGNTPPPDSTANTPSETTQQDDVTAIPVKFQIVDIDIQKVEHLFDKPAGAYWVSENDHVYLVVSAGEKPSAGYSLHVESVAYDGTALKVKAILQTPNPGDGVAAVITYPMLALSIEDATLHQAPATVEWITDEQSPKE